MRGLRPPTNRTHTINDSAEWGHVVMRLAPGANNVALRVSLGAQRSRRPPPSFQLGSPCLYRPSQFPTVGMSPGAPKDGMTTSGKPYVLLFRR